MAQIDRVQKLIDSSGNAFHAKVARWFLNTGWQVTVSPYYMDQSQSKAREIDLVVEKVFPYYNVFGKIAGLVAVRLFVECKYLASQSVLWFAGKDESAAMELVCASGLFIKNNTYTNQHHYIFEKRVVKLFSTAKESSNESEPIYKALNQTLNGFVSMRGRNWHSAIINQARYVKTTLEFPVVVCSSFDQLFMVPFESESPYTKVSNNFQLEVRYAYFDRNAAYRNDYFLLDFIEFDRLAAFVGLVEQDVEVARKLLGLTEKK